jgi:hypothetical protein
VNNEQNKEKSETDKLRDANKYSYLRRQRKRVTNRNAIQAERNTKSSE